MCKRSKKIIKHIFNRVKSLFCGLCKGIVSVLLFVDEVLDLWLDSVIKRKNLIVFLLILSPEHGGLIFIKVFWVFELLVAIVKTTKRESL